MAIPCINKGDSALRNVTENPGRPEALYEEKVESEASEDEAAPRERAAPERVRARPPDADELAAPELAKEAAASYSQVERRLIDRLVSCFEPYYTPFEHRQIGRAQFDLVLQGKEANEDLIVEVKFTRQPVDWRYVRANLLKTVYLAELYLASSGRRALPVVFFVAPRAALASQVALLARVRREARRLSTEMAVKFIALERLANIGCRELTTHHLVGGNPLS